MKIKKTFLYVLPVFCSSLAFADGENYDGQDVSGLDFSGASHVDSSWIGCTAIGTVFSDSYSSPSDTGYTDYSGSNFTDANLTNARFSGGNFTDANFTNANLSYFLSGGGFTGSILTNADFTNAIINGRSFKDAIGFTAEQLASTQSFKNKDLSNISPHIDISSLDLTDFNITETNFSSANLRAEQLYSTANYKNKNLWGVGFYTGDYSGWNFVGQNLQNTSWKKSIITNADATGADLRGASLSSVESGEFITKNTIMSDGVIKNFSMQSSADSLIIRKYVPEYGDSQISAKISESDAIVTGGAQLSLEQGAKLEVTNGKTLTVASGGKLLIQTDADSTTEFLIDSLAGLEIGKGAELIVDVVWDFNLNDFNSFILLEWNDNSKIIGLSDLVKNETLLLTLNGESFSGKWDYVIENNQFIINFAQVPEPAACAAVFGILALAIAAYRRRK